MLLISFLFHFPITIPSSDTPFHIANQPSKPPVCGQHCCPVRFHLVRIANRAAPVKVTFVPRKKQTRTNKQKRPTFLPWTKPFPLGRKNFTGALLFLKGRLQVEWHVLLKCFILSFPLIFLRHSEHDTREKREEWGVVKRKTL